jgi:selenocysteine lyase/cysteine desulfurase
MEQPLMEALVGYLAAKPDVILVGPRTAQKGLRVPVVSFMVAGRSSADITAALQVTLKSRC